MKDFSIPKDKSVLKYMGDISQLAGAKRYEFLDGKAKGVEAVDIKTGSGFEYTVLPGRGMDIAHCSFKGIPLSYISKTKIVSPSYFDDNGMDWLRSFFAGMLTTCGLSNVGGPCEDEHHLFGKQRYGLHGRISNSAAYNVGVQEEWESEEDFVIRVNGKVREAQLHGECLELKREYESRLGENKLIIHDCIENKAQYETPCMILYHINIGYPVLNENSRLLVSTNSVKPNDEYSKKGAGEYDRFTKPGYLEKENLYFHDLKTDDQGNTVAAIINDELELGVYVKFNKNQLPQFTQWKMCGEQEYVLGLEPGNCLPTGRVENKKSGILQYLEPNEKKIVDLEIGVLKDDYEIEQLEKRIGDFR